MSNLKIRILSSFILAPIIFICIYYGDLYFYTLLFIIFIIGAYEILLLKKKIIKIIILFLFIFFLLSLFQIRFSNDGFNKVLFCLFLTWISDIGGYLFGKFFKGKKINIISPNKTYSGFVGAIFLPQIILFYLINNNILFNKSIFFSFLIIFIFSIISVIGDLFFSYLKRLIKIKDYSQIIPGHGGLFDRIDSLIFVVIFFYIIFK